MRRLLLGFLLLLSVRETGLAVGQAASGALSEAEVESLRDAAYVPVDRIRAYERILDTRAHRIDELVAKRRRPGTAQDLHDAIDQFAGVVDELNDNLDEFEKKHRDIRKELLHLNAFTDRWSKTLQSPPDDDEYNAVRKIALHNTEDTRSLVRETTASLEAYFKEHPEAAAAEKKRNEAPHAPTSDGPR